MSQKVTGKKVAVVMPAYFAAKTLQKTYDAIPKEWIDEIILVDDASTDGTASLSRALGIITIVHPKNRGYGGNQKTCYKAAVERGADIVVMVHPDFQYNPSYVPQMITEIAEGRADACFGSRMIHKRGALKGGMPYWKFIANIGLTWIENTVLGLSLTEYHSGFRAYSREVLTSLPIEANSDDFIFDSEIIVQLRLAGFHITEIPIETRYFSEASMIGFWRSVKYGIAILRLLFDYLRFRFFWDSDLRFLVHRISCVICESPYGTLRFPGTRADERAKGYQITERASGTEFGIYVCLFCKTGLQLFPGEVTELESFYALQPGDQEYLREEAGRRKGFREVLEKIERYVPSGKLLDFGAGPGIFLSEARKKGWEVHGIELSHEAIKSASELYDIALDRGGLERLQAFPSEYFDVITAFDVIEHLKDPVQFGRDIRRVLKPGGLCVITTPKFDSLLARIMMSRWYAILPAHLVYFTNAGIDIWAKKAGLVLKQKGYFKRYFTLRYILYRLAGIIGISYTLQVAGSRSLVVPLQLFDEFLLYFEKPIKS